MVAVRNIVLLLLCITVVAPIVLYTDRLGTFESPSNKQEFIEDVTAFAFSAADFSHLNLLPQETSTAVKEPVRVVYTEEDSTNKRNLPQGLQLVKSREHVFARMLSTTTEEDLAKKENPIKLVTDGIKQGNQGDASGENVNGEDAIDVDDNDGKLAKSISLRLPDVGIFLGQTVHLQQRTCNKFMQGVMQPCSVQIQHDIHVELVQYLFLFQSRKGNKQEQQLATETSSKINQKGSELSETNKQNDRTPSDARVKQIKDQLIQAKVYLSLPVVKSNPHLTRELRLRVKEVSRTLGEAIKDSDLPRNANERMRAMEQTLMKGKQAQDDCAAVVKKLRAMLHSSEEQLHVLKKQTLFLTQLTAKTLPKGLHCLPLRLTTEYHNMNSSHQQFPHQENLEDPHLYHYAIFSDNILATAVVVNSTVSNTKLGSQSMIDYYFKAHRVTSDSNLKFRNPKYLSILNHLRFYLPEIFPKLNKVLFLDDDIVVQKDLTDLWSIDLKGNVNGAVETCGESFHRFDRYLNFSNPLIAKNFDPHACGWAYGMNVFDLAEWKRQNITEVYHNWQNLNHDRQLWKLGTLPPGLITFWKRTFPLNRSWHILGLGYNPNVNQRDIEQSAVVHYNGNMKPWLEISIPKFRRYWTNYVDYDHVYLRECNINP
ncbi:hypothetical protein JHK85_024300 [Glycine max]|nr:hypothetical protein JHK85_024300 [Glycine max]